MAIERTSAAEWKGDLRGGSGTLELGSGAYSGNYSFVSRFETGEGTNPEELIAAAHAACYSMALSNELASGGHTPDSVATEATVTLDGLEITTIHLACTASVPDIDDAAFQEVAAGAKENCPVSKVLAGAEITLEATLL
ncbi:OsmC family protein [Euzebya tangerina]|uniref:OsmC family protein n=1 Tax=Euzebya tangerina TaxID=591198 RepID=UPI000E30F822|nr:OsmC family protein [Euzebya tangerina]